MLVCYMLYWLIKICSRKGTKSASEEKKSDAHSLRESQRLNSDTLIWDPVE